MAGEIDFCLYEFGSGDILKPGPLGLSRSEGNHVSRAFRTPFRLPLKPFQHSLIASKLDGWVSVAFYLLEIIQIIDITIREGGREHLGLELVDRGESSLLFDKEQTGSATHGIKSLQDTGGVEICHHLSPLDLVITEGIFLDDNESVRHQARFFQSLVLQHHGYAVGRVLTTDLIPHHGGTIQAHKRVEVRVDK